MASEVGASVENYKFEKWKLRKKNCQDHYLQC